MPIIKAKRKVADPVHATTAALAGPDLEGVVPRLPDGTTTAAALVVTGLAMIVDADRARVEPPRAMAVVTAAPAANPMDTDRVRVMKPARLARRRARHPRS